MRQIRLRDAQRILPSLIDEAARGIASIITRGGKPQAVIIGFEEWERLTRIPSFGRLLISAPLSRGDLPHRNRRPMRRMRIRP